LCIDAASCTLDHGRMRFLKRKAKPVRRCPNCRERLPGGAKRCEMCGELLQLERDREGLAARASVRMHGF